MATTSNQLQSSTAGWAQAVQVSAWALVILMQSKGETDAKASGAVRMGAASVSLVEALRKMELREAVGDAKVGAAVHCGMALEAAVGAAPAAEGLALAIRQDPLKRCLREEDAVKKSLVNLPETSVVTSRARMAAERQW